MDRYRGVSALVTGATGFIGRWTCRRLIDAGAHVVAVVRDPEAWRRVAAAHGLTAELATADLARPGALATLLAQRRPAITFNLAGYGVERTERDASLMTRLNADLVVEAAEQLTATAPVAGWSGLRLVHVGSAFEYGDVRERITEDTPPRPGTDYGRTKLEGTRRLVALAHGRGLPAATARVCTVYGPGEHPHRLLPSLIRLVRTGETLELTAGEQLRDFTYVEDIAEGLLRLGLHATVPGGVVNLATGTLTAVREFIGHAQACLGLRAEQLRLGAVAYRPDEVWQGPVDVTRLRSLVGWVPSITVPDGIRRTAAALAGVAA